MREWSWLKGGVALGLLSAFAFLSYKPLGTSTSYPRAVALALKPFAPEWVANNAYFQIVTPVVDWQLMLVIGIIVGGFLAARFARRTSAESPATEGSGASCSIDERPVSRTPLLRFIGGFLLIFGARLAGGCTSGHIITGMTQLAIASFLFGAVVFAVGIPMAKYLNGRVAQ